MKSISLFTTLLLAAIAFTPMNLGATEHIPQPPTLPRDAGDPSEALQAYPLGVIDELTAFGQHGGAHQKITLPNGHMGWVYEYGYGHGTHRYILEFDQRGVVSNVIYRGLGPHDGISALILQSPQIEKPREEHGGWQWPSSN
ncbi:MAG: hypothetical protein LPK43_01030 [Gammaproteobacteria bacterium]|nr:hypothetical protein [Chromatiales bacterium]MDX5374362.1 hypothetical protein [Gammaproteobacteria bacterium]